MRHNYSLEFTGLLSLASVTELLCSPVTHVVYVLFTRVLQYYSFTIVRLNDDFDDYDVAE